MRELGEAELSSTMLAFLKLTTPLPIVLAFRLARCNEKPSESCQKDVKKLSKTTVYQTDFWWFPFKLAVKNARTG